MFLSELAKSGIDEKKFREEYRTNQMVNRMLDKKFSALPPVTDQQVRQFYDENKQRFPKPKQVRASHILIGTDAKDTDATKAAKKKTAQDLKKQIEGGADFAKVAEENSSCPSKEKGGDLGLFQRGMMVKPFENAAFSMKVGEVSDVVETQFGYHIIKVTEIQEEGIAPFEEVQEDIRSALEQRQQGEAVQAYIEELKAKARVDYPEPQATDQAATEAPVSGSSTAPATDTSQQ